MSIEALQSSIPDFAKDIRLNVSSVLTEEGAPELSNQQIAAIALASAYATKQPEVINAIQAFTSTLLDDTVIHAVKAATSIMAMNNIYYRFVHLVEDKSFSSLPAKLRMNIIANPGIAKVDFELCSLAVSAVNGCGMCMEAHVKEVQKAGISKLGIQSCVRIAAVIHAAAQSVLLAKY